MMRSFRFGRCLSSATASSTASSSSSASTSSKSSGIQSSTSLGESSGLVYRLSSSHLPESTSHAHRLAHDDGTPALILSDPRPPLLPVKRQLALRKKAEEFESLRRDSLGSPGGKTAPSSTTSARLVSLESRRQRREQSLGELVPLSKEEAYPSPSAAEVPQLVHGLDRVIFNPGVHTLRNLSTGEFQFPEHLSRIAQPDEIDYDRLPPFVPTSKDHTLRQLAREHRCRFVGSTSSLSGPMSQIYWALIQHRQLCLQSLSSAFLTESHKPTRASFKPQSFYFRFRDNVHSVDSNPGNRRPGNGILLDLGKSMERMLTMSNDEFSSSVLYREDSDTINQPMPNQHESYHYLRVGDLLMRSQLDCMHPGLPDGKNTFDLKTRATAAVRMDCSNYLQQTSYRLKKLTGFLNSYEREFYDMARSIFLKYNFQVRIGHMHGIFVAYHNTAEIFGFEYISQEEIDEHVFGSTQLGDHIFSLTTNIFSHLCAKLADEFPASTLRVHLVARRSSELDKEDGEIKLSVFAEEVFQDAGWLDNREHFKENKLGNSARADIASYLYEIKSPVHCYEAIINLVDLNNKQSPTEEGNARVFSSAEALASHETLDKLQVHVDWRKVNVLKSVEEHLKHPTFLEVLRSSDLYVPGEIAK